MKTLSRTAMAVIGLTWTAVAVQAQVPVNVNYGDLVLGFRNTSGQGTSLNLEVDLGSFSNFLNASGPITLSGPNGLALQDLINTYGASWNTNSGLLWSVASTSDSASVPGLSDNTLFVTSTGTVFKRQTSAAQQTVSDNIGNFIQSLNGTTSTTNSTVSSVVDVSNTGTANYTGGIGAGTFPRPYNATSASLFTFSNIENNTNIPGGGFVSLTLEQLNPTASGTANATILGDFRLSSNGTLTFVPPTAIPEPSTFAMISLGGICAVGAALRRRRAK